MTREFSAARYTYDRSRGALRGFLSDAMRVLIQDEFFCYVTDEPATSILTSIWTA